MITALSAVAEGPRANPARSRGRSRTPPAQGPRFSRPTRSGSPGSRTTPCGPRPPHVRASAELAWTRRLGFVSWRNCHANPTRRKPQRRSGLVTRDANFSSRPGAAMSSAPPPSGHQQFLFVPSLICYAFSVELGLKALALFEGKAPRWGHDLKDLLSDLSPGVQARIVAETRTQGERPTFFDQQLEIVRHVFDVCRYIYEKD